MREEAEMDTAASPPRSAKKRVSKVLEVDQVEHILAGGAVGRAGGGSQGRGDPHRGTSETASDRKWSILTSCTGPSGISIGEMSSVSQGQQGVLGTQGSNLRAVYARPKGVLRRCHQK